MSGIALAVLGGFQATAAATLNVLGGTFTLPENAAAGGSAGTVSGATASSTLSLFDNAGGRVALSGSAIVRGATALDYETATSHSFTVRETLAGATNSPRDTVLTLNVTNVFEAATLSALALDSTTATQGSIKTVNITGATAGSVITVSLGSIPAGMTLNSGARTISGTPTGTGTSNFTLRETLADSPNSPLDTAVSIAVSAAPVTLATLTLSANTVAENSSAATVVGAINGKTAGSSLAIFTQSQANWFAISGNNLVVGSTSPNFETTSAPTVTIRETLAGATNTPKDTVLTLAVTNVFEASSLSALSLDSTAATQGTAKTINILSATTGSTITVQTGALPAGMTLNSAARTISGTPSGTGTSNFTLRETLADSANSPRDTALSVTTSAPAVTLASLSLSANTITENSAAGTVIGAINSKTSGSTLSVLAQSNTNWFGISGTNLVVGSSSPNYEVNTAPTVTIRETLAGASNTPKDTLLTVSVSNVFEAGALGALSLSSTTATVGGANTINIVGATSGSTISVASGSLPAGMTLNSAARTISGTPTTAATSSFTLQETLADSSNSPRSTSGLSILTSNPTPLYSGSWENTLDSWNSNLNHTFAAPARTGSYSLQRPNNAAYTQIDRTFTGLPAGTLTFSVWHRAVSGSGQRYCVYELNGAGGVIGFNVTDASATFTEGKFTISIPAGSSIKIYLVATADASVPAFDDWSLTLV